MQDLIAIRNENDVAHAIDSGRPLPRMKAIWILGFGGIFVEGYSGASLSSGLHPLTKQLDLTPLQVSFITASYLFVAILLSMPAGRLADRIGRIPILLAGGALALASMALAALSQNFEMLLVSRFLFGASWACMFAVALTYVSEFIPARHQHKHSRWQGIWYLATTINLLSAAVTFQFVGEDIWRWMMGSAALLVALLVVAQLALLPESPRWLASKGRIDLAVANLKKVYDAPVFADAFNASSETSRYQESPRPPIRSLFQNKYRKGIILGTGVLSAHAMQYYAVGWYLPVIAATLFGDNFTQASIGAAVINFLGMIGGFSAAWIGSKLLARTSARIGFGAIAVIFVVLGVTFDSIPLYLAVVLLAAFLLAHTALTAAPAPRILALTYPGELRAGAMGVATTGNNTAGAIALFMFPLFQAWFGSGNALLVMSLCPIVGLLIASVIRFDPDKTVSSAQGRVPSGVAVPAADKL